MPQKVIEGLGKEWRFPARIFYKTYPCCGAMQNVLGLFHQIITANDLYPEHIKEVIVVINPLGELPAWKNPDVSSHLLPAWKNPDVSSHLDIQFNTAFLFSLLAHRVEIGPLWQSVGEFAKKVRMLTHLDKESEGKPDVTVVTSGEAGQKIYTERGLSMATEMSKERLIDKFKRNAQGITGESKASESIDVILGLEEQEDISMLMKLLVPR
jgi:hypothetical protein